jgi:hypothetical protein
MLLLPISITSVLWALVWLCIAVALIYLLGIAISANVVTIIKVILILLALIFIINHFFLRGGGIDIRP